MTMISSLSMVGASFDHLGQRMGRLERRDDALDLGAELEGVERLLVGGRHIFDAADVVQPGMLRADAGIVEAGRDRVGLGDLAVAVLQQIGAVAVQDAGAPAVHRGGVAVLDVEAVPAGLDADRS